MTAMFLASPFDRLSPAGERCRVSDRVGSKVDLRSKDGEGEAAGLLQQPLFAARRAQVKKYHIFIFEVNKIEF